MRRVSREPLSIARLVAYNNLDTRVRSLTFYYPLVPYPHTYIALYFSYTKVTCNTHTHKETRNCFHPSDARSLVSLTTTPLLSPFHWEARLLTPKLVIPVFGATRETSLCVAFLTFVCSRFIYGVKVTGVFYDSFT